MGRSAGHVALALCAVVAGGTCSCSSDPTQGYQVGNLHRPGIRSVAVPAFTRAKDVYRRGVEIRLTEAVVKQIQTHTPYTVTTRGRADTVLTGTLEQISQRVLNSDTDTGRTRELEMILVVSIRWKDLRTGEILLERKNLRAAGAYIPPAPLSEDFFQGSQDALNRLARRIVETMEADW